MNEGEQKEGKKGERRRERKYARKEKPAELEVCNLSTAGGWKRATRNFAKPRRRRCYSPMNRISRRIDTLGSLLLAASRERERERERERSKRIKTFFYRCVSDRVARASGTNGQEDRSKRDRQD